MLTRALAFVQVALVLSSLFAAMPVLAADVAVPAFSGQTGSAYENTLASAGLVGAYDATANDPSAAVTGVVPAVGTQVPAGSTVTISTSAPATPPPTPAPTPAPTDTPAPTPSPTDTPAPTPAPTDTPAPTPAPTDTPAPTPGPTDTPAPTPPPTPAPTPEPTTSYIVAFTAASTSAERAAAITAAGGTPGDAIPALNLRVAIFAASGAAAGYGHLLADPIVTHVDADAIRDAGAEPSDPSYATQWSLPRIGWDQVFGSVTPSGSATVAVLDTGVDASHPDLAGQLVPGTSTLAGGQWWSDPNGHGTAMAGIVAALTDNGQDIAGVGYAGVRVLPVTVLGPDGTGQDSDIIAGVVAATDLGADVILMAFSNPGYSSSLQAAIDYAWGHGVVVVAATGNEGSSATTFPAGDRGVVGVSNTTQDDSLNGSSNYGVDTFLAAPGTDIPTLAAGGGTLTVTGTSASAAAVAAAAALVRANDPTAANGVVVNRLAESADAAGTADQTGNGRLNLARAIADTSTASIEPAGAPPTGDGGPFVGPYVAGANCGATLALTSSANWSALTCTPTSSTVITVGQTTGSGTVTLTVDVNNAVAGGITLGTSNVRVGALTFNAGSDLAVTGGFNNGGGASSITMSAGGTLHLTGSFAGTGAYSLTPGVGTVEYNGTGSQTIAALTYNNLTISGARTTNSVTLASSGTIGVAGAFTATATFTSGSYVNTGSTVNYNGTGAQTVSAFNYNNLTISGAHTTNNVTLASSGTIGVAGTFSTTATFTSGGYVNTGSTVNFNGSGSQTIPAFNYNNLTSSSSGARTLASSGTVGVGGTFTPGTNAYTITGSTIDYNSAGAQTVSAFTYNNLSFSGGNTKTAGGAVTVNGTLTIGSGTSFDGASFSHVVLGTWTNDSGAAAFIGNTSTVTFGAGGSLALSVGGTASTSFNNFTLNNGTGITLGQNAIVNGTLALTLGTVTTSANILTANAAVTRGGVCATSCFVNGNLQKPIATGSSSPTFEVGTGSVYAPVSLSITGASAGGNLTASSTAAQHPQLSSSGINTAKRVNRYWTLTAGGGLTVTSYNATFNFASGDLVGTPDTSALNVRKYNGSTWSAPPGGSSSTSTSVTANGYTSFSDFAAGELLRPTATIALQATSDTGASSSDNVTNADPLVYNVNFSESVSGLDASDFSVTGTGSGTCVIGSPASGPQNYTVALTGCSEGTVILTLAASSVTNTFGNSGPTSPVSALSVLIDRTSPTVTINQAGAQSDPTSASPINFTAVFSESVADFATGDVTVSGTAGATSGAVTGGPVTYNVAVSDMTGNGTVTVAIAAGVAHDTAGNPNTASTTSDDTVTYDASTTITGAVTFPASGGSYNGASWMAGCSTAGTDDFCGTAAPVSGHTIQSVQYSVRQGLGNFWDGSGYNSGSDVFFSATTSDAYAHWTAAWPFANFPSDGTYRLHVVITQDDSTFLDLGSLAFTIDTSIATPVITGSTPASPSNTSTTPTINGTAEADSSVKLFTTNDCSGSPVATGTASGGGSFGIGVTVTANTSTTYYATATDAASNVSGCSTGFTYTHDSVAPTLTAARVTATPTNQTSLLFTITGNEPINCATITSTDFTLTNASFVSSSQTTASQCTVTISTTIASGATGTSTAAAAGGANFRIADTAGNNATAATGLPLSWSVDRQSPTVSSINRVAASDSGSSNSDGITNAASVQWTVVFSEAVSGVDSTDFGLVASGPSGASITTVAGTAPTTTWTVTVNAGSGDGTLGLNLNDNDSIVDTAGNPLAGTGTGTVGSGGTGNGSFAGQVYTIDRATPTLTLEALTAGPTSSPTLSYRLVAQVGETLDCATISTTTNVDFANFAGNNISSISGLGASGSNICTFTVTSSIASGAAGTTSVVAAGTFSVSDLAGNAATTVSGSPASVQVDRVTPTLNGARVTAATTNQATLVYRITLTNPSNGGVAKVVNCGTITSGDFTITNGSFVSQSTISDTICEITVTSTIANGASGTTTVALGSFGVADTAGNNATTATGFSIVWTVDRQNPTVSSINRVGGTPTNAGSVSWTVTFSETVSGVDATDFVLVPSGLGGTPAITSVTGSGPYTVTASTGTGDGTLGLNLNDDDSITDAAANPLAGAGTGTVGSGGAGNGSFAGQVFTIDRTSPTLTLAAASASPTNNTTLTFTLTGQLGETLDCATVTSGDFTQTNVTTFGAVTGTGTNVCSIAITSSIATTTAGFTTLALSGTFSVSDQAGNTATTASGAPASIAVDRVTPTLTASAITVSPTNQTTLIFRLTLTNATNNGVSKVLNCATIASSDFTLTNAGTLSETPFSGTACDVSVISTVATTGSSTVDVAAGNGFSVSDTAGNAAGKSNTTGLPISWTVDLVAPTVASINRAGASPTTAASVDFTVTFSEAVSGPCSNQSDFTVVTTGTIAGATITGCTGASPGATRTITVGGYTGEGSIRLDQTGTTGIVDTAGNALTGTFTTGQTYVVDHTPPVLTLAAVTAGPTANTTLLFSLTAADPTETLACSTTVTAADFTITNGTFSGTASGNGSPTCTFSVTTTIAAGTTGTTTVALSGGFNVADQAGNATTSASGSPASIVIDRITPNLAAASTTATPTNQTTLTFTLTITNPTNGGVNKVINCATITAADFSLTRASFTGAAALNDAQCQVTLTSTVGAGTSNTSVVGFAGGGAFSVSDVAGNAANSGATTGLPITWTVDLAPPTATLTLQAGSDTGSSNSDRLTNATSLTFNVTFSENVTGFDASDLSAAGTAAASCVIGAPAGGPAAYTVTLTNCGEGTLTLTLGASAASDSAANLGPTSPASAAIVTIDRTPSILAAARVTPTPTSSTTLQFTVSAGAETIVCTTLTAADFVLTNATFASSTQTNGSTCTLAITSGVPNLTTGTSGADPSGAFAASDVYGNVSNSVTGFQIDWTVDRVPPVLSGAAVTATPTSQTALQFTIIGNEPINCASITGADFNLTRATFGSSFQSDAVTCLVTVNSTVGAGTSNTSVVGITGGATFSVTDVGGAAATTASGFPITWTVDRIVPTVTLALQPASDTGSSSSDRITNALTLTFNVTFSEAVTDFAAADLSVTGTATGCSIGDPAGGPTAYTVTLTGCSEGTVTLTLAMNSVSDTAGNLGPAAPASAAQVTVDRTGPTVTIDQAIGQADPAHASPIHFTILFNETVADFTSGDLTLSGTAGADVQNITGGPTTYDAAVNGMTGEGTVIADVGAGVAHDTAGNPNQASTSTDNTVDYDGLTLKVTFPGIGVNYTEAAWTAGCSTPSDDDVCGTAKPRTGFTVASVVYSMLNTGTGLYWDGSGFNSATEVTFAATTSDGYLHWSATFPVTNFPDGTFTFAAHATQSDAATANQVHTFTIDRVAPTLTLAAQTASPTNQTALTFTLTGQAGEHLDCATISATSGVDFDVTNGTIGSTFGTGTNVCVIPVTSTIGGGSSGVTSLAVAASFSVADQAGNASTAAVGSPASVTVDRIIPTLTGAMVTVTPTNQASLSFTISGDEPIDCTTLTASDFTLTRATFVSSTQSTASLCTLLVTSTVAAGATNTSVVALSGPFGANDLAGNGATSASNFPMTWTVDRQAPTVTVALSAASDSGLSSSDGITNALTLVFNVTFSESVTGFAASDLSTSGDATGCSAPVVGGGPAAYTVTFTSCGEGTLTLAVAANAASDLATNLGPAGQTSSGTVRIDRTGPSVTLEQAVGQADPAYISPVNFTVTFDDNVADFVTGDVTLGGTAGATTATVTGSAKVYTVAVTGQTLIGTITASLAAGVAHDAAGNASFASTSADNLVNWDNSTASISGYVFNDVGLSHTYIGSIVLSGVTVCVDANLNGSCVGETKTAVSNASGQWTISGLPGGTYSVTYTPPTGWINTGITTNNDPSDSTFLMPPISVTLVAGEPGGSPSDPYGTNTGVSFYGYKFGTIESDAQISGSVYDDPDGSGDFSGGDSKYTDTTHPWTVFDDANNSCAVSNICTPQAGEASTTADNHGNYTLGGLIAGTHHLVAVVPTGWKSTDIDVPLDKVLTAGQSVNNVDFFMAQHFVSGKVINDANGNGVDDGEAGLGGATLTVYNATFPGGVLTPGSQVGLPVTTKAHGRTAGNWTFGNVGAGEYLIVETDPTGFGSTNSIGATDPSGSYECGNNDGFCGPASHNKNWLYVHVAVGGAVSGAEFLDREKDASISGLIYRDGNGDGIVNGTDTTLDGGSVTLYNDTNANGTFEGAATDLPVSTSDLPAPAANPAGPTTSAGTWTFANLFAGTYFAVQTGYKSSDWVSTNAIAGGGGTKLTNSVIKVVVAAGGSSTNNQFLDQAGDLQTTKSNGVTSVIAGNSTTYTITVTNVGAGTTPAGATVSDPIPGATTGSVGSGGNEVADGCAVASNTFSCTTSVALASGASRTYHLVLAVASGHSLGSTALANTATSSSTLDFNSGNNSSTDTDAVTASADLQLFKTATGLVGGFCTTAAIAGCTLEYTLQVHNLGPSDATGVSVAETLPTSTTYTNQRLCQITNLVDCTQAAQFASFNPVQAISVGTITAGADKFIKIRIDINASVANGTSLTNSATVTSGATDPTPADSAANDGHDSVSTGVITRADLAITKNDGVASVAAGAQTTYSLTLTNNGPSDEAIGAVAQDVLPTGMSFVSAQSGCGFDSPSRTVTCTTTAAIAPSGTKSWNVTVLVASNYRLAVGSSLPNTAFVFSTPTVDPNPDTTNNSNTDTDTVFAQSDLAVTKDDGVTSTIAGAAAGTTYTITLTNNGPSDEPAGIKVADTIPAGTTGTVGTGGNEVADGCAVTSGVFSCTTTASLANGASRTYHLKLVLDSNYRLVRGTSLANTAGIAVSGDPNANDGTPANNSQTDTDTVTASSDLEVTKTDSASSLIAGDAAGTTYTITLINHGPSDEPSGIVVSDTIPTGTTGSESEANCSITGGATKVFACTTSATLASGASVSYQLKLVAASSYRLDTSTLLSNNASITTDPNGSDSVAGNNTASDTDSVIAKSDLMATKSHSGTIFAGANATYTIGITNNGPSDEPAGAKVSDVLTSGLTFVSAGAGCTYTSGTRTVECTAGRINNGASQTFGVTVTVASGYILDQATTSLANSSAISADPNANDPTSSNNTASDPATVFAKSDLAVTKSDGAGSVYAGESTTYTITLTNNGPSDEPAGVKVSDAAPAGTTLSLGSGGNEGDCVVASNVLTCTAPRLNNTASRTYHVTLAVSSAYRLTIGTTLLNTASVTTDPNANDPSSANNSGPDSDSVLAKSDLAVTKSDSAASVYAGESTTYTITLTNNGPSDEPAGVKVSDAAPAGTIASVGSGGNEVADGCAVVSNVFSCTTTGALANGASRTYHVSLAVASAYRLDTSPYTSLKNTASVATDPNANDPSSANNSADDTDSVLAKSDLAVTKSDATASVYAGANTTYTLTLKNNGPSDEPAGATVTDSLPAGTSFVSADAGCAYAAGVVTCTAARLNNTASTSWGVTLAVASGYRLDIGPSTVPVQTLKNTAVVGSDPNANDPTSSNNSNDDTDSVFAKSDLQVTKTTDDSSSVFAGTNVTYTITLKNNGPSDEPAGATVTDTPPAGTSFVSAGAGCAYASGVVTCTAARLNNGASQDFSVTLFVLSGYRLDTGSSLTNTANVGSDPNANDPDSSNNAGPDTDSVLAKSDLAVTKSDGSGSVFAGTNTTYTIGLTNNGPSDEPAGAKVSDALPTGVTYVSSSAGCAYDSPSRTVTCTAARLNNAGATSWTVTVTVASGYRLDTSPYTSLKNTASVATDPNANDPSSANNSADDTDSVLAKSDLEVTKTDGVLAVYVGDSVTYTITLKNNGPSDEPAGVTITDSLPAGTIAAESEPDCSLSATAFTCTTSARLNSTQSVSYQLTLTVANGYVSNFGTSLSNRAGVAVGGDPNNNDVVSGNNTSAWDTDTVVLRTTALSYNYLNQAVQYSDGLALAATFVDTTHGNVAVSGLPITFSMTCSPVTQGPTPSVNTNGSGIASTSARIWLKPPIPSSPPTCYVVANFAGDGTYTAASSAPTLFTLTREDAQVSSTDPSVSTTDVTPKSGTAYDSLLTLNLTIDESSDSPNTSEPSKTLPGGPTKPNLTGLRVDLQIVPVGAGTTYTCTSTNAVYNGSSLLQALGSCNLTNIEANLYEVDAKIVSDYFVGPGGDVFSAVGVLLVYDPTQGMTTGGGWVTADDGSRVNFGFNAKNLKSGNTQGNFLAIWHRSNGNHVIKSTSMGQLAVTGIGSPTPTYWIANITNGKATYTVPSGTLWCGSNKCGNFNWQVYAEDIREPGNGYDHFWMKVTDPNTAGTPTVLQISMPTPITTYMKTLSGGNIQIPH